MLKEIFCSKLADKKIVFGMGLNVVVGDDNAANSIGKSSALLLIDFAFGGNTYSSNNDLTDHVGDHDVKSDIPYVGCFYGGNDFNGLDGLFTEGDLYGSGTVITISGSFI